jgi:hypothetical protein
VPSTRPCARRQQHDERRPHSIIWALPALVALLAPVTLLALVALLAPVTLLALVAPPAPLTRISHTPTL